MEARRSPPILALTLMFSLATLSAVWVSDNAHAQINPDVVEDDALVVESIQESSTLRTLAVAQLTDWTDATANTTGAFGVQITVTYDSGASLVLLDTMAMLYFSVNDRPPHQDSGVPLNSTDGQASQSEQYSDILSSSKLAPGHTVRFVIEIYQFNPGGDPEAIACDYGRRPTATDPRIEQEPCEFDADGRIPIGNGFRFKVDNTRPQINLDTLHPPLNDEFEKHLTTSDSFVLEFNITDTKPVGPKFAPKLDPSTLRVTADPGPIGHPTGILYDESDGIAEALILTISDGGYKFHLKWDVTQDPTPDWPEDEDIDLAIDVSDFAANPLDLDDEPVIHVDTTPPPIVSISLTADPTANQEREGGQVVEVTGLGATATVQITVDDPHIVTSDDGTVEVFLFNETNGFFTDVFVVPFDGTGSGDETDWEGEFPILPGEASTEPEDPFFVKLNITVVDALGLTTYDNDTLLNPEILPGSPTIEVTGPTQPHPGFVVDGPYEVEAAVTAAIEDFDIDDATVIIQIHNETGSFASTTGWTEVSNDTFEKVMTVAGSNYTADIPDASAGAVIEFQVRAQDEIGNLGLAENVTFEVDKEGPSLDEFEPKEWRGAATHTFQYAAIDSGAGVNGTSGKLFVKKAGGSSFNSTNMTFATNIFTGSISAAGFAHLDEVEYYAEAADNVGHAATNGTEDDPMSYKVDLVKPTITLDPLASTSSDGQFEVSALGSDADSGMQSLVVEGRFVRSDGTQSPWITIATRSATSGNSTSDLTVEEDVCLIGGGIEYHFRAKGTDRAGNEADYTATQTVTVSGPGCNVPVTVEVTSPVAGDQLDAKGGSGTHVVEWVARAQGSFASDAFLSINIEFSPDDGGLYIPVATGAENTGSYSWVLEVPSCSECRIRVTAVLPDDSTVAARSDAFTILNGKLGTDYDGNGLSDECEVKYWGQLGVALPGDDPDGDGLSNLDECNLGTNPLHWDTDGDGYSDGVEFRLKRNPLDANDRPTRTEARFTQWGPVFYIVPALFLAVTVVFLLGLTRRW